MKKRNSERGQAAIFTVLAMTVLLGFVALATDVGVLLHLKRNLQTAADAAAIAGAAELGYTDLTTQVAGQTAAAQNLVSSGAAVTIGPPNFGVHAGDPAYVEAVVSQNQQTIFAATFAALFQGTSLSEITVRARAVATNVGEGCVYGLGTAGPGISVTTTGPQPSINAPLCGVFDNSISATALDITSDGTTSILAKSIGIVGDYSNNGGGVSPQPVAAPVAPMVPVSDPLAYLPLPATPAGGCLPGAFTAIPGTTTIIPAGDYCTGISVAGVGGTLEFSPGIYYIDGGFSMAGAGYTLSGAGVTFYLNTGALSLTASPTTILNLTAPTSGTYHGVLFDQNPTDVSGASITVSTVDSVLEGALYFPETPTAAPLPSLTFTATGSSTNLYLDFVADSLNVTTNNTTINNYAALLGSADPIEATILVE